MAYNWYPCSALTGGGTGALDALDAAALADGDRAVVITASNILFYWLDDDSAAAESSPDIISPDTNPGTKRWLLVGQVDMPLIAMEGTSPATAPIATATESIAAGSANAVTGGNSSSGIFQGTNNTISTSGECVIIGGYGNTIASDYDSVIIGGYQNSLATNYACTITGGQSNAIGTSNYSLIGQGQGNDINVSDYSFIGGGYQNILDTSDYSFIGGGQANDIQNGTDYCFIGGGYNNSIATNCDYNVIVGGSGNTMATGADYAIIGGGTSNTVSSQCHGAVISGGYLNQSTIRRGIIPGGRYGKAYLVNQMAFSAGRFSATGDSQASKVIVMAITTGVTAGVLRINQNASTHLALPASRAWRFDIKAIALQTAGASGTVGDVATWSISGGIKRDGSNNTTLVGTPSGQGVPGAADRDTNAAAWDLTVTADDANESLVLTATGGVSRTIHWTAKIDLVEVG